MNPHTELANLHRGQCGIVPGWLTCNQSGKYIEYAARSGFRPLLSLPHRNRPGGCLTRKE